MFFMTRKIRIRFVGPDQYKPEDYPETNKFISVIGTENKKRKVSGKDGKPDFWTDDLYFVIVGKSGKTLSVSAINCNVIIDESAELNTLEVSKFFKNITILAGVICEKFGGKGDSKENSGQCTGESKGD